MALTLEQKLFLRDLWKGCPGILDLVEIDENGDIVLIPAVPDIPPLEEDMIEDRFEILDL